jgi:ATP-binding cassette subfamily F protein uup
MLEEILANYQGTIIIVSHDRDFLDQTVTKIMAFEGDGNIEMTIGGYSDYLLERKERERAANPLRQKAEKAKIEQPKTKSAPKKLTFKIQHEFDGLPLKISLLESDIKMLERRLDDPNLYKKNHNQFTEFTQRLSEAKEQLASAEHRWLEIEEMRKAV